MIYYVRGDIFIDKDIKAFAHGCNCMGGMNAGIAVQFKKKWPKMFSEYKKICMSGKFNLGDIFLWEENNQHIFNLATQQTWEMQATIEAISLSFSRMLQKASEVGLSSIVMPKIGAGFGGLKWFDVKMAIEKLACDFSGNLVVCENFIKGMPLSKY